MLTIRLQRVGAKNKAQFRIVLAQAHKAVSKQVLEVLGFYDPRKKKFFIKSEDRLKYWLSHNVQVSGTVHNLLVEKKLLDDKKVKAWRPKIKQKEEAAATPEASAPAA
jgi:ribosomal protein S16